MYSFLIWDKVSDIGNIKASDIAKDLNYTTEKVYFIMQGEQIVVIQTESMRPYKDKAFEESAQLQCNDMNIALEAEQLFNDTKAGYLANTILDSRLDAYVTEGKLTQEQADEIKASKTQI